MGYVGLTALNIDLHGFHRANEPPPAEYSTYYRWQFWSQMVFFASGIANIVDRLGRQTTELTTLSIGASSDFVRAANIHWKLIHFAYEQRATSTDYRIVAQSGHLRFLVLRGVDKVRASTGRCPPAGCGWANVSDRHGEAFPGLTRESRRQSRTHVHDAVRREPRVS